MRSRTRETGLMSTELALLMPIMLLFAFVAVTAVQIQRHGTRARSAADAAARAASLHHEPGAGAEAAAPEAAGRQCQGDVGGLSIEWVEPDEDRLRPGHVTVSLTCTERFGGLSALVGVDERSVQARAVSALEYWRPAP